MKRFRPLLLIVVVLGCGSEPIPTTPVANNTASDSPAADVPTVADEIQQTTDDTDTTGEAEVVAATTTFDPAESQLDAIAAIMALGGKVRHKKRVPLPIMIIHAP